MRHKYISWVEFGEYYKVFLPKFARPNHSLHYYKKDYSSKEDALKAAIRERDRRLRGAPREAGYFKSNPNRVLGGDIPLIDTVDSRGKPVIVGYWMDHSGDRPVQRKISRSYPIVRSQEQAIEEVLKELEAKIGFSRQKDEK